MIRVEGERWIQTRRESMLPPTRRLVRPDEDDFISYIEDRRVDFMTDRQSIRRTLTTRLEREVRKLL